MVTVTLTAKTHDVVVDTMSANFATSSTAFVDVTDASVSVPNNYYHCARLTANTTAVTSSCEIRYVEGATNLEVIGVPSNASNIRKFPALYKNTQGSAQTVKWQARAISANDTITVLSHTNTLPGTFIAYAPNGIASAVIAGDIKIPIKIDLTEVKFLSCSAQKVGCMGATSDGDNNSAAGVAILATHNTIASGIIFSAPLATVNILWDWSGDRIQVS